MKFLKTLHKTLMGSKPKSNPTPAKAQPKPLKTMTTAAVKKKAVVVKTTGPKKNPTKKTSPKKAPAAKRPQKNVVQKKKTPQKPAKKMAVKNVKKKITIKKVPQKKPSSQQKTIGKKTPQVSKKQQSSKKTLQKSPPKTAMKPSPKAVQKVKPPKKKDIEFATALLKQEQQEEKKPVKQYPVLPGGQSERVSMLLPILKDLVKKGQLSDWCINLHHSRNANLYVERNFITEDELSSIREDVVVTIYERFNDGNIGEAQLPIITTDPVAAKALLLEAKTTCSYARKKAFTLPRPSDNLSFPQAHDERMREALFNGSGIELPRKMLQQIRTVMTPILDVRMNCCEILTSAGTSRVINSNGIDVSYHKTNLYLELTLTCRTKVEEREFLLNKTAVSPDQLDLQNMLLQQAQIVRDATTAKQNPGFVGDVLLAGPSITEFFAPHHDLNPLVLHTFAKLEHMGLATLKMNQPIGHFVGEPISITSNPALPLGLLSCPVDEEGTPARTVELIRSGVFVQRIATERYAQYLGIPSTGNIGNIQVSPGATREQHLRGNNYFEIVSFSWFNPNPFSGDFSAEIRLGYHWVNGRKTSFRGGTFTGNIFKNILNARLSKEITQAGHYYGPRAVLFKNGTITKFE